MRNSLRRAAAVLAVAIMPVPFVTGQNSSGRLDSTEQQNTALPNLRNPYRTVYDIVTMPEGRKMGSTNAINVDAKGNIWVFERCGANSCADSTLDPILKFDPSGKFLRSFGAGKFVFPHAIEFDTDSNLWIVDAGVVEGGQGKSNL